MRKLYTVFLVTMVAVVGGACGAGAEGSGSGAALKSGVPGASRPEVTMPLVADSPRIAPTATLDAPSSPSPDVPARTPATAATPTPSVRASASASASPPARAGCLKDEPRDVFMGEVLGAIRRVDRQAISDTMARNFQYMVAATDVSLDPMPAAAAARQLFSGVPDPEGGIWFMPVGHPKRVRCAGSHAPRDLGASRGFWPTQWDVAVEVTGLGADGDATGWLMLGTNAAGQPVWRGLVFGFPGVDLLE